MKLGFLGKINVLVSPGKKKKNWENLDNPLTAH